MPTRTMGHACCPSFTLILRAKSRLPIPLTFTPQEGKSSDTRQREELRPHPGSSVLEQTSPKDLWGEGLVSSSSFHGSSSFSWVRSARTGSPASRETQQGPAQLSIGWFGASTRSSSPKAGGTSIMTLGLEVDGDFCPP